MALEDHGNTHFDSATMQCGDVPVILARDANHDRPLLHEASQEGMIAGRNAAPILIYAAQRARSRSASRLRSPPRR